MTPERARWIISKKSGDELRKAATSCALTVALDASDETIAETDKHLEPIGKLLNGESITDEEAIRLGELFDGWKRLERMAARTGAIQVVTFEGGRR